MNRNRHRAGRAVFYNPTAAEEVVTGPGPYPGMILRVRDNGSVDLAVFTSPVAAVGSPLADPLVTQADASAPSAGYVQAEAESAADLANANKAAINSIATLLNQVLAMGAAVKQAVVEGSTPGTYSTNAGPQSV